MGYGQTAGVHRTESYAGIGLRIQQIMNAAPQRAAPYRTTAPPHHRISTGLGAVSCGVLLAPPPL